MNNNSNNETSKSSNIDFSTDQLLSMIDNIPICVNVLNEKAESVYCNDYTVDLYDLDSKQTYIDNFYNLTPETQPNGINSKLGFGEQVLIALEKGEHHFSWLDIKLTGEEIPLYISIYRLNTKDDNGNELLLSAMRDLRPQLAGDEEDDIFGDFYNSRITYKDLFNTVAELTEEWFWIYDNNMSTIQFFGKGRSILGLSAEKQPFPSYVVDSGMVYPDDLEAFLKFDNDLKTGQVFPAEVRFVHPNGASKFYRIIYKTIHDKNGKPSFSIGKTYDIDKQKRLEVLSKTDLLTNCLNKVTTENVIKDALINSPESSHALFIIDVDDFKAVNDELGHYFGDIVLSDIAKNLHANFRGADIIGRIGGDEFLVFVKNIYDKKVIQTKAQAIADAFKSSYSGENNDYKISGSIGVALFPKHASTYEGLYKCADKALYNSKAEGKDRYTIYSDELSDTNTKKLTAVDNANKPVNAYFDVSITSAVFDLMYQAENVKKSMETVVKLVGTHMVADRCYVAQTFDDGGSYSITYEWISNSASPMKSSFQNIPSKDIEAFFSELEKNGIMFNSSISPLGLDDKETNSFLIVQTKGKGNSRLVFGIEDNNKHRIYSEKEINTFQYILKLISIFIASNSIN